MLYGNATLIPSWIFQTPASTTTRTEQALAQTLIQILHLGTILRAHQTTRNVILKGHQGRQVQGHSRQGKLKVMMA